MIGDLELTDDTMVDRLRATVAQHGSGSAIHYLGRTLTWSDVDQHSDAIAAGLQHNGVGHGDRVALLMQNVPQYMLSLIAVWKLGAVVVPINPMLTPKDVRFIVNDAEAVALIGLDDLVGRALAGDEPWPAGLRLVVTTRPDEFAGEWPDRFELAPLEPIDHATDCTIDWSQLVGVGEGLGSDRQVRPDDPAVLTYTSGTTGPPKGATNTQRNVVYASRFYERWVELDADDVVLGIAPLFHITGLIAHMGPCIVAASALVLGYRYDVELIVDQIERYRPTFTIGAITAFIGLMNHPAIEGRDLSSLTKVYSGGAPIAPATVDAFQRKVGPYIHNIYGLTEATGPCLSVPLGWRSPVDPATGALAAGIPVCNVEVRLVRDDGTLARAGEPGEVTMRSPGVVPGYWHRDDETAHAIRDGWLHTGDVAVFDDDGWFYIVDRLKDQINASGFKVWPREVEDALMAHPDVIEAAVVGVPDDYRGETVKGFAVLVAGSSTTPTDLIAFCRDRLAAYKYPREVEIVDQLPRNASGKVLRRELRSN